MQLPNVELSELRYFHAVASSGSFAEGARLSHVSAPTVSKAIKKLEDNLGATFFDRSARRASLTPQGVVLLEHAKRVLESLLGLAAAVDVASQAIRGELRVGTTEEFSAHAMPVAIVRLARTHPDLIVRTYVMGPQEIVRRLNEGGLDLGLTIADAESRSTLLIEPLIDSPMSLVCGRGHALFGAGIIDDATLACHTFVVPQFFGEACASDHYPGDAPTRRVGATAELHQMAIQMVVEGGFLGYFPDVMIRCQLNHRELHRLEAPVAHATVKLVAARRPGPARAPALDALVAALRVALEESLGAECAI